MDFEKSLNSDLLEEVFNEVEGLDDTVSKEPVKATDSDLLEELIQSEKEKLCKSSKNKSYLQEFNFLENTEEKESVVHEGLTTSSDDEDDKYFEESIYNECGRTLKNLIKQKDRSTPDGLRVSTPEAHWGRSKAAGKNLVPELTERLSGKTSTAEGESIKGDPILGMNIINPLISSMALKDKLIGRVSISTSKVKSFLETPASKDSDWVTGGAIVSKATRTSQKGNQYCVWQVTDLRGDIKTVRVFLFGSAYKEYWKTSLGTVIGILNPLVMENKDKSEATLRVDNAQKVLVLGMSKDYGICKSKKKNGENCFSVVNKSKCEYCVYHMKKEYNKACRRADLQPPKVGRNLDALRAKVLGKNPGKTFTGIVGRQSTKQLQKDEQRMKLLSQARESVSDFQKQKDEVTLKRLERGPEEAVQKVESNKNYPTLPKSQMIDLGFNFSKKERQAAMANALKYVREHGPLKKLVDKCRTKKPPEQISSIKRKLEIQEENESKKLRLETDAPKNTLEEKRARNGITQEFLELMNSGVRNSDLVKAAETEERDKYFSKLETREKIENKMATTFKVECKAVRCLKCNYKTFSASDFCKKEKHPLKVVNAFKRFWKCGDCSARTVCLELVPLHSCKVCGSSKWERTSMMPEKKDGNVVKTPLSLRGDEEKFLRAGNQQANLNLLVPEETS